MTEHTFMPDQWCIAHSKYCGRVDASEWFTGPLPEYLLPAVEDDGSYEGEPCYYCEQPIDEDHPGEPCSGADGPLHADCHNESGCTRVD